MGKQYYWLRLKSDFFENKLIKKIRRLPGGDTLLIIYMKLLLISLKTDGLIRIDGVEENVAEELSLMVDEEAESIQLLLLYCIKYGLITKEECGRDLEMVEAKNLIGHESAIAARVRKHREKKKALQCNADVTKMKPDCNVEIEIEKEIEIEIEIDKEIEGGAGGNKKQNKKFLKPTVDDVKRYCEENGFTVDENYFVDYYESNGWIVGKSKMKDWKATVRNWQRRAYGKDRADNGSLGSAKSNKTDWAAMPTDDW